VKPWVWLAAGLVIGADWLRRSLLAGVRMKELEDLTSPKWDRLPDREPLPSVTVVVPAKNEESNIEQCLRSLVTQDYAQLSVCAIDDRSSDNTGAIMDRLQREFSERLRVIHITELPPGWLGKTHAMWSGASQTNSEWILFTDGDIFFRRDALRRALAYAEAVHRDFLMLFPKMIMKGFGEKMVLSFFALTSILLVRPWNVKDRSSKAFVGAGSFNLIRRSGYEELGTYKALRMEVVDDLMLGKTAKDQGLATDCAMAHDLVSVRWAQGAFGVVRNLQKNLFSMMRFSWALAAGAAVAALIYHVFPWIAIFVAPGITKVGFALAVLGIVLLYARVAPIFEVSPWFCLTHPVAALLFIYALLNSALSSLIHGGVQWRGTTYSLEQIQASNLESRREGEERRRNRSAAYTGPERRKSQPSF